MDFGFFRFFTIWPLVASRCVQNIGGGSTNNFHYRGAHSENCQGQMLRILLFCNILDFSDFHYMATGGL